MSCLRLVPAEAFKHRVKRIASFSLRIASRFCAFVWKKNIFRAKIGPNFLSHCSKPTYRDIRRDPDQVDAGWPNVGGSGYPRNALQDHCAAENANFRLNVPPRSAPSSGFSSPLLSPRRVSAGDFFSSPFVAPYSPAVWSAPEFPSKDMPGHSAQAPSELVFSAPDRSLLHSPNLKNPGSKSKNPSGPPSPLHSQYGETATAWRDSSAGVTVHPLPLPPGVVMPMQPPSSHQNGLKNEAAPMTNHWQKGKLIGSGTFGNVYVATNRYVLCVWDCWTGSDLDASLFILCRE